MYKGEAIKEKYNNNTSIGKNKIKLSNARTEDTASACQTNLVIWIVEGQIAHFNLSLLMTQQLIAINKLTPVLADLVKLLVLGSKAA